MFHHVARTEGRVLLYRDAEEARFLWTKVVRAVPGLVAVCLMPDHVHVQAMTDSCRQLSVGLSAYVRWLNPRLGRGGSMLRRSPPAQVIVGEIKSRRSARYIHLNPCRAGLVADPLDWAWSSYRDALGLTLTPARGVDPDPGRLHAYVSSDPTVHVRGTELPGIQLGTPSVHDVFEAVGGLCRVTPDALRRRGPPRSLFMRAARVLSSGNDCEIAAVVAVNRSTVNRCHATHDSAVRLVARVCGDPRFHCEFDGDYRQLPAWRRYRDWR